MYRIQIAISANQFTEACAKVYCENDAYFYTSYSGMKFFRFFTLLKLILVSNFYKFVPNYDVEVIIPHSYGNFATFLKLIHHDKISVCDDGISLLSCQEFQKAHILPFFGSSKFNILICCDLDLDPCFLKYRDYTVRVDRKSVLDKMKEKRSVSKQPLTERSVVLIDNGLWDENEVSDIRSLIASVSSAPIMFIIHPSRKLKLEGIKLDYSAEIFLSDNFAKIELVVGGMSTVVHNFQKVYGIEKVRFLKKYCLLHSQRLEQNGSIYL